MVTAIGDWLAVKSRKPIGSKQDVLADNVVDLEVLIRADLLDAQVIWNERYRVVEREVHLSESELPSVVDAHIRGHAVVLQSRIGMGARRAEIDRGPRRDSR